VEIVSKASDSILKILKPFRKDSSRWRMIHYCVEAQVEDGVLLFNYLTRELLLLTKEEYADRFSLACLKERWFVVPEETCEKEYADLVRWYIAGKKKRLSTITGYTIFTTTDCNARCFYCFEKGRHRIPMSHEVAENTVQYIKEHCKGEPVVLHWFGGEPLFNMDAIDTISSGLGREGIEFKSKMVSNGYLFDDDAVGKAKENWNLRQVQITLDGTEAVYNRSKNYIYRDGSPYRVVLENITRLLDASIDVTIRLNMDLYNAENLLELVEELAQHFGGRPGIHVYAYHIFDAELPMSDIHTEEEWEKRDQAMQRLEEKIADFGLAARQGVPKVYRKNHCMADSGNAVTILPTGDVGLCDHFSEDEYIGHIDREGFDEKKVQSWAETVPAHPECMDCFYYPSCWRLKKCANSRTCFRQRRQERYRKTQQRMLNEYRMWQENVNVEQEDDLFEC